MEHWESLCPGGYRFVYDDVLFPPGTDTFLLSSLPRLRPGLRVCDLGAGTGLLGLLLLQRQPQLRVTGVELQESAVRLAERAAAENRLTDRLFSLHGDLRQIRSLLGTGSFDLVVSNPPYYAPGSGALAAEGLRQLARAEVCCTLEEVSQAAAYLLRWGGSFCVVHKPERLTDEEYKEMKSHVVKGGEILKSFTLIDNIEEGALYHHERYDGKGYVHGLKGEEIPLNARIIGIADAFDAMTANRVYRKKLDMDFVIGELKKGRGTQFDPQLTDIMLHLIETGQIDMQRLYDNANVKEEEE